MLHLTRALVLIASLVSPAASAAGQDGLSRAKDLYLSAAYDDALSLLDGLQKGATGGTATEVAQYRAFCLLALQRTDDAKKVIEGMVRADPTYRLAESQASPRIHGVFLEVRRAVLPDVVQQFYAGARSAFERQQAGATAQFDFVLSLLDDPDMRGNAPADFRTVVTGFRDLSRAFVAAAPPPAAAPEPAPVLPPPSLTEEVGITPPVALSQPVPRWVLPNGAIPREGFSGRLRIEVDPLGNVASATLEAPIYPRYDDELLRLAKTWRFKPAMKAGEPVSFVTIVEIQRQRVVQP